MPKKTEFTEEQIEEILLLHQSGLGSAKIAAKLGFSKSKGPIQNFLRSRGLKQPSAKVILNVTQIELVKKLFADGDGAKSIAKKINLCVAVVKRVLTELSLKHPAGYRKIKKIDELKRCKRCKRCEQVFPRSDFYKTYDKYLHSYCKSCNTIIASENRYKNLKERQIKEKAYREDHKKQIRHYGKIYESTRKASDITFKLRREFSSAMSSRLKNRGMSKRHVKALEILGYTIEDLRLHLESKFESWMNWGNHGMYNPSSWNDDNPSTWTWNIDHIIPHSDLMYASFDDENFKKAWSLDNLRPLNSKQNLLDGVLRTRHNKQKKERNIINDKRKKIS